MDQRALPAVPGDELWRFVAPWLGYVVIGAAGLLGLSLGSRTADPAGHEAGVLCFFLAVALAAWRVHRQTGGAQDGLLLNLQVKSAEELLSSIAVFGVLGVIGLGLAGVGDGAFRYAGLVFFACCAGLVLLFIKGYFDYAESGQDSAVNEAVAQKEEGSH
jgi:hypothetical protein